MNKNGFIIRLETSSDYTEVENLTREAFWNQNVPGCYEHYFAHVMRHHKDFIPELDFVIEFDGKIIGNVMYTKAKLIDENGFEKQVLSFGPVSILPKYQRKGFGKALLEHSFLKAAELGYDVIVIFGHPSNYISRGFKSCKKYNICLKGNVYPTAMLVKELKDGVLDGRRWCFHESSVGELCEDPKAVYNFDARFPHKEKNWMPSQEEFYIYSHSTIV